MKIVLVVAAALSVLVLGAGAAHAHETDQEFLAYLVFHGLTPASGEPESVWNSTAIKSAHEMCTRLSAGQTKSEIVRSLVAKHGAGAEGTVSTLIDAAETFYCPAFKGQ